MDERSESRRHPETGAPMVRDTRDVEFEIGGEKVVLRLAGWYCTKTGEGVFVGRDLLPYDRAVRRAKARRQGLLAPEEIRLIRKKLGLTQAGAAEIIGGGPKAFQKYEAGDVLVSRAVDGLLRLLDHDPSQLDVLRRARDAA